MLARDYTVATRVNMFLLSLIPCTELERWQYFCKHVSTMKTHGKGNTKAR